MHRLDPVWIAADLRQALRGYAAAPGLTAALILTIGAGAGGNAAMLAFIGGFARHAGLGLAPANRLQLTRVSALLLLASVLVLVLASATVAGLLLSRASARARETAVKISLGASRLRLVRQTAVESVTMAVAGGLFAIITAVWTSHLVPMLLFAEDAGQMAWSPDGRWLALTTVVWVIVITACGLAPAAHVPQDAPFRVLTQEGSGTSRPTHRFRAGLVVGQIALCALLVEVAGVLRTDLQTLMRTARGRQLGSLLVADVETTTGPFDDISGLNYLSGAQTAARKTAGVTGAAWIGTLPGNLPRTQDFIIEPSAEAWTDVRLDVATFSPTHLAPSAMRVTAGRLFQFRDGPGGCPVGVINEAAADRVFAGDAIGRRLQGADGSAMTIVGVLSGPRSARPLLYEDANQVPPRDDVSRDLTFGTAAIAPRRRATLDVNVVSPEYFTLFDDAPVEGRAFTAADRRDGCRVGVVTTAAATAVFGGHAVGAAVVDPGGDRIDIVGVVHAAALGAATRSPAPMILLPLDQSYVPEMTLAIRTTPGSHDARAAVERALHSATSGRVMSPVETLESRLARTSLAPERIASALVSGCAVLGLIVSIAGVYAVMADLVTRRRRDLAVRIALGAHAWRLVGDVVHEGLRLAALGVMTGVVIAAATAPLLNRFVVRSDLPGPVVLIGALTAVSMLVTLASALPAWRAVRVDPRELI